MLVQDTDAQKSLLVKTGPFLEDTIRWYIKVNTIC